MNMKNFLALLMAATIMGLVTARTPYAQCVDICGSCLSSVSDPGTGAGSGCEAAAAYAAAHGPGCASPVISITAQGMAGGICNWVPVHELSYDCIQCVPCKFDISIAYQQFGCHWAAILHLQHGNGGVTLEALAASDQPIELKLGVACDAASTLALIAPSGDCVSIRLQCGVCAD